MIGMLKMEICRFGQLDYHAKEAVNTLSTNLSLVGGDYKKLLLTSCHPGEGKSFVAMNLLRAFAELGLKVVLVDADIRASSLIGTYDIRVESETSKTVLGLSAYLAGRCSMNDILGSTNIPNAWMVLAGKTVINSLSLFASPRFGKLMDELAERFDIVLVDAPPIGTIIDPVRIAEHCDGMLMVVQSGAVVVQEFASVLKQIEKTKCPLLGTVLNKFDEKRFGNKYYYSRYGKYSKYYYDDGGKRLRNRK